MVPSTEARSLASALSDITDLARSLARVRVRVYRRSPGVDPMAFVTEETRETLSLADAEIWLSALVGGGDFIIVAHDVNEPARVVLAPVAIRVDGPPRPMRVDAPPPLPMWSPPWQPQPWRAVPPHAPPSRPAALDLEQLGLRRELEQVRAELALRDREAEERERRDREDREAQRHSELLAAMRAASRPVAKPEAEHRIETVAAIAAAVGPILTALISSSRERDARTLELVAKRERPDKGLAEALAALAPVLAPPLMEFFKNKSPAAQAELFSTLAENNLTTLSTMGSFLQTMMEMQGSDPWWRPLVENGIQSVTNAAQQYAALAKPPSATPSRDAEEKPRAPLPQGRMIAMAIVNRPDFPRELKRGAWVEVMAALHDKAPPENIAQFVRDELIQMRDNNALPELLAQAFETPEQSIGALISLLPIYKTDRPYANTVINAIGDAVRATTGVETEDEAQDDEDQGGSDAQPDAIPFNLASATRRPSREAVHS